jgi:ABC-2 type transport system ATP-binding protein
MKSETNQSPAIQVTGMSKNFGPLAAVDHLSLEVQPGTIFGFLGPNGAGKTTTIRLLLGLLTPSSGQSKVLGFDTQTQSEMIRSKTGALLEHTGIYEKMSAEDNLEFYGRVYLMSPTSRKNRIEELLSQMGLWDRRSDLAGKWSRGMKQRLALARALFHKPKLVFLDEPTAGLDVVSAAEIRKYLQLLVAQENITVFLTTHNMAEVEQLCSQVGMIKRGKLIAQGSPEDLKTRKNGQRTVIEGSGFSEELISRIQKRPEIQLIEQDSDQLVLEHFDQTDISDLVTWLVQHGVRIDEVRHESDSLENVFINMMEEGNV